MKIIYLHGFASVGVGPKSDALRKKFGNDAVYSPDLPIDPDAVEMLIDTYVAKNTQYPLIFVGTSLGGFWANYFAQKWDSPCVIVNPSTSPSKTMWERVGKIIKNYSTGELMPILEDYATKFGIRESYLIGNTNGALINVFVAKDDDVIPYKEVLENIPYRASCTITEDGGHRYDTNWGKVVDKVRQVAA